jgi:hypothetical protein
MLYYKILKYCLAIVTIFMTTACYKQYLYVQQQWVDKSYLASSHVNTPDPEQLSPPYGRRINISWNFPVSQFRKGLTLIVTVRFNDNTQDIHNINISRKSGYTSLYFPDKVEGNIKKVVTYKMVVVTQQGEIIETWKHQLWVDMIAVGDDTD